MPPEMLDSRSTFYIPGCPLEFETSGWNGIKISIFLSKKDLMESISKGGLLIMQTKGGRAETVEIALSTENMQC